MAVIDRGNLLSANVTMLFLSSGPELRADNMAAVVTWTGIIIGTPTLIQARQLPTGAHSSPKIALIAGYRNGRRRGRERTATLQNTS
jgi:hypothetical protein